jgi:hypothetical protein
VFRLALFYRRKEMENPELKRIAQVLEVAGLLNGWSVRLFSIQLGIVSG